MASRIIIFITILIVCSTFAANIYVATNGNDATGDGSIGNPYATISNAVIQARLLGTNVERNIIIRGGKYYNVAVVFQRAGASDDSYLNVYGYPNETATLYGGMLITNWIAVSNGWYSASLPTFPSSTVTNASTPLVDWQSRMLLVNGVMAEMSQYPTNGVWLYYTNHWDDDVHRYELLYTNNDLGAWLSVTNVELQIAYSWNSSRVGAISIDTVNQWLQVYTNDSGTYPDAYVYAPQHGFGGYNNNYRVYNIAQGMSRPGQFFYDRGPRNMVYWPTVGQNPNSVECIVPTTSRIFYFLGGDGGSRLHGITISNLTLSVATCPLFGEGEESVALNCGAIHSIKNDGLVLDGLNLGPFVGHAYYSRGGDSTNETIKNCTIRNCGGGAIQSGVREGSVFTNNLIEHIGSYYPSGPGIFLVTGLATHNSIFDCQQSGVSGSYITNAYIINNHLSNCMQTLRDMGAIYTYIGDSNVISSNLLQHTVGYANDGSSALDWFHIGIYLDQYINNTLIECNITIDAPRPLMVHQSTNDIVRNNIFLNTSDIVELHFRGIDFTNCVFSRNICYCDTNLYASFYINWLGTDQQVDNYNAVVDWRSNVFYSVINQAWGGTNNNVGAENGVWGIPTNSVASNPLFVKVPTGNIQYLDDANFGFQPGSPCPGLGIQPLSLSGIGYNGGLNNRLPVANVSTLRVGNMRMSQ